MTLQQYLSTFPCHLPPLLNLQTPFLSIIWCCLPIPSSVFLSFLLLSLFPAELSSPCQRIVRYEPPHEKTSNMSFAPSEDSDQPGHLPSLIRVFTISMEKVWSLANQWAHSEDSDQTGRMPRLIRVYAGRTVILLVLSWGGSYGYTIWVSASSPWLRERPGSCCEHPHSSNGHCRKCSEVSDSISSQRLGSFLWLLLSMSSSHRRYGM